MTDTAEGMNREYLYDRDLPQVRMGVSPAAPIVSPQPGDYVTNYYDDGTPYEMVDGVQYVGDSREPTFDGGIADDFGGQYQARGYDAQVTTAFTAQSVPSGRVASQSGDPAAAFAVMEQYDGPFLNQPVGSQYADASFGDPLANRNLQPSYVETSFGTPSMQQKYETAGPNHHMVQNPNMQPLDGLAQAGYEYLSSAQEDGTTRTLEPRNAQYFATDPSAANYDPAVKVQCNETTSRSMGQYVSSAVPKESHYVGSTSSPLVLCDNGTPSQYAATSQYQYSATNAGYAGNSYGGSFTNIANTYSGSPNVMCTIPASHTSAEYAGSQMSAGYAGSPINAGYAGASMSAGYAGSQMSAGHTGTIHSAASPTVSYPTGTSTAYTPSYPEEHYSKDYMVQPTRPTTAPFYSIGGGSSNQVQDGYQSFSQYPQALKDSAHFGSGTMTSSRSPYISSAVSTSMPTAYYQAVSSPLQNIAERGSPTSAPAILYGQQSPLPTFGLSPTSMHRPSGQSAFQLVQSPETTNFVNATIRRQSVNSQRNSAAGEVPLTTDVEKKQRKSMCGGRRRSMEKKSSIPAQVSYPEKKSAFCGFGSKTSSPPLQEERKVSTRSAKERKVSTTAGKTRPGVCGGRPKAHKKSTASSLAELQI